MAPKSENITRVERLVSLRERQDMYDHKGGVIWFTGLSGSGKSTLSVHLEKHLFEAGFKVYVLDGDNLRHGLNGDLGFSAQDRNENIRRVGEVAALFAKAGFVVLTAFISPYRNDRQAARKATGDNFHEIHVSTSLETCEARDPKGLYQKARSGEIADFTGISAPYENPENPELSIDTADGSVEDCMAILVKYSVDKIRL